MDTTIGGRLRELRHNKGLSQNAVAKLLGISRPAYVSYESNNTKPVRRLSELASILGTTSDYILNGSVQDNENTASTDFESQELLKLLLSKKSNQKQMLENISISSDENSASLVPPTERISITLEGLSLETATAVIQALREHANKE